MGCKERLEQYLREQSVPFQVQHHPETFTAQELAASEHVSGKSVAKVVMVLADGQLVMLALPAPDHVDLAKVRTLLGARDVRLAGEADFASWFPDCEVGAMPPFGHLYELALYLDESLVDDGTIYFQAGTHTDTISMSFADYQRLAHPAIAVFARGVESGTNRKGGTR